MMSLLNRKLLRPEVASSNVLLNRGGSKQLILRMEDSNTLDLQSIRGTIR